MRPHYQSTGRCRRIDQQVLLTLGSLSDQPLSAPPPVHPATQCPSAFASLFCFWFRPLEHPRSRRNLGCVDLKCSFIVDTRRFDHPVVYCSPSFCTLSGYSVIGKNCRLLQAPVSDVRKGDRRKHPSQEAVAHLKRSPVVNKKCQTTIRNFRKDGSAFMNLLAVIPLPGHVSYSLTKKTSTRRAPVSHLDVGRKVGEAANEYQKDANLVPLILQLHPIRS